MSRYRFLREIGCDPFTAAIISWTNDLFYGRWTDDGEKTVRVLHITIEWKDYSAELGE